MACLSTGGVLLTTGGAPRFKPVCCVAVALTEKRYGSAAIRGTARPSMEDAICISVGGASQPSFFGVFDGHGGDAVAEMLRTTFWQEYEKEIRGSSDLVQATRQAYLKVDERTLAQPKGLFGALRERGVGGSRCGATAATVLITPPTDDKPTLVAANVGDARVVISSGGKAIQLTVDHKPDVEAERKRIESRNPTPKKPLVTKVGGAWRVGGLLALSRAFGDAYLKDWSDGKPDGARAGFGLTAEPDIVVQGISSDDKALVIATDGLWDRFTNQEAVDFCLTEAEKGSSAEAIANKLVEAAQSRGSTDDIAVIVLLL